MDMTRMRMTFLCLFGMGKAEIEDGFPRYHDRQNSANTTRSIWIVVLRGLVTTIRPLMISCPGTPSPRGCFLNPGGNHTRHKWSGNTKNPMTFPWANGPATSNITARSPPEDSWYGSMTPRWSPFAPSATLCRSAANRSAFAGLRCYWKMVARTCVPSPGRPQKAMYYMPSFPERKCDLADRLNLCLSISQPVLSFFPNTTPHTNDGIPPSPDGGGANKTTWYDSLLSIKTSWSTSEPTPPQLIYKCWQYNPFLLSHSLILTLLSAHSSSLAFKPIFGERCCSFLLRKHMTTDGTTPQRWIQVHHAYMPGNVALPKDHTSTNRRWCLEEYPLTFPSTSFPGVSIYMAIYIPPQVYPWMKICIIYWFAIIPAEHIVLRDRQQYADDFLAVPQASVTPPCTFVLPHSSLVI